ncbi:MAG: LysR substrate-binding domain-containing protein [Gammaproteobacteria bacterium]|nr:LysR substrate-binding domain-containing protein [Gammaproteobacteria bacterium]
MLRVSVRQLQAFDSVARHLSFTRAAEELFVTQSTISLQIKHLSESLGIPLFEQVGKKLYLTAPGKLFYEHCRKLLTDLGEIEREVAEYKNEPQGMLCIAGNITSQYFLPRIFGEFYKAYPNIDINLTVARRPIVTERLENNADDLYVFGRIPTDLDVKVISLVENPLVVIAPRDHPLAKEKNISLARLMKEPFIVREPGSTTLKEIQRFCEEKNIRLNTRMTLGGNEAIKQAVIGGLGLSVLSRFAVPLELKLGLLTELDVEGFPIMKEWYLAYAAGKRLSPAARAFVDFAKSDGRRIAYSCLSPSLPFENREQTAVA